MRGSQFITIASVVVAAASVAYAAGMGAQAPASSQPVYVSNTTAQCVPTSIYHSIAIPTVQSGAWNVSATGDKLPFEQFSSAYLGPGTDFGEDHFTVPAGKRLIVDSYSVDTVTLGNYADAPTHLYIVRYNSGMNMTLTTWYESLTTNLTDGEYQQSGQMHLIAEPGEVISVQFTRPSAYDGNSTTGYYTLVGHYVTVP